MIDKLVICQWNVWGLGDPNRVRRLKKWISNTKNECLVISLQETKIKKEKLQFHLKVINVEATHIIYGPAREKLGAPLIIPKNIQVLDQGTKGDGLLAWAKVSTEVGDIKRGSVYAPSERRDRIRLWKWMRENLV